MAPSSSPSRLLGTLKPRTVAVTLRPTTEKAVVKAMVKAKR
jgi:hypothetical protein